MKYRFQEQVRVTNVALLQHFELSLGQGIDSNITDWYRNSTDFLEQIADEFDQRGLAIPEGLSWIEDLEQLGWQFEFYTSQI